MRKHTLQFVLTSSLLAGACAPRASYVGSVGAFATQTTALSSAVTAEFAQFASDKRTQYLRLDLFQKVRGMYEKNGDLGKLRPVNGLLCEPAAESAPALQNSAYLAGISSSLQDVSGTPAKKTGQLIGDLFKGYAIKAPAIAASSTAEVCMADLKSYVVTAYPEGQSEFAVGGAIAGAQALWKIFDSLANGVLQQIDEARRAEALRSFFSKPENVASLRSAITQNAELLKKTSERRRMIDVRNVMRAYNRLSAAWKSLDLTKVPSCKLRLGDSKYQQDASFQACFDDAWDSQQKEIATFLQAAAAYDKDAAARPDQAAKDLNKTLDKLIDISTNEKMDATRFAEMLSALFDAASSVATLEKNATSDDTKRKVDEALANFK